MSAPELRNRVRDNLTREILGGDWRVDDPLNFGGLLGKLFAQIRRGENPAQSMGEIDGRIKAISAINDAMSVMNGSGEPPPASGGAKQDFR